MAEEIRRVLLNCAEAPKFIPYACITASKLTKVLEKIKKLDSKSFSNVYEYAKKLNLPPDFQEELKFEYKIRGF